METRSLVRSVFELVRGSTSLADLVRLIAEPAGALVDADRVLIAAAPSPDFDPLLFEWTIGAERPDLDALRFALGEAVLLNLQSARPARGGAASELVNRYAATLVLDRPILVGCQTESGGGIAILASRSASRIAQGEAAPRRLGSEEEELLQNFLELATAHLQRPPSGSLAIEESGAARAAADSAAGSSARKAPYHRLVEHSDAIIFTTDAEHRITFISKRVIDFFGVPAEEFLGHGELEWFDLIHLEDRDRARRLVDEQLARGGTFDEELRIINHITGRLRWLLVKLTPVRDSESKIVGWDGFGVDITARRDAQDALEQQSKKVRALYTVSSSVRGYLDPASIAARGLEALCDATGAHAAACYLFPTQRSRKLGLVAHHGFSPSLIDLLSAEESLGADGSPSTEGLPGLLYPVVESGQPYVIPDLGRDVRARKLFGDEEGLGAAVLVPVAVEEEVFGALALFHRERGSFDGGDVMLVSAAASQIGLAARQATLFTAYRRQTKNLAALYRLTHELSQFHSLEEVFQQAFSIIRDELGLKRLWLGLLSDSGTHVIGQAAYGPGWKRQLVEINVDVSSQEHPIAEVVRTQKPILISDPGRMLRQFGLRRFFSRFGIKTLGVVPLVARGEVLGVLAVQPGAAEPILDEET